MARVAALWQGGDRNMTADGRKSGKGGSAMAEGGSKSGTDGSAMAGWWHQE